MIKITNHLRINVLTIFIFAFDAVFYYPPIFYITYGIMLLHELAHMLAAVCMGLKVDYFALQPFGANLRLKNKMTASLADDIILYISGPLVNALAAVVSAILYREFGYDMLRLFYITNIALFTVNLLPAMPLDGGVIFRQILTCCFGCGRALKISRAVSAVICILIGSAGVYVLTISRNFSVLVFSLLILGNIFTQNEKYYGAVSEARRINRLMNNNITVS